MRTFQRFVLGTFCALLVAIMGACLGFVGDDLKAMAPLVNTGIPDRVALTARIQSELAKAEYEQREITCLANIVQSEGGGEIIGNRYLIAMIVKARRDDPSKRWGTTFCEIAQKREFNGLKNPHDASGLSSRNIKIAAFIYRDPWKKQLLPRGWQCVRNYAVPLKLIKKLSAKRRKQLGITKAMKGYAYFQKKLRPVARFGGHEAYEPKAGCDNPLPTT